MVEIQKLIAAISPEVYCDPSVRKEVKKIVKEEGYLKAAEIAKPFKGDFIFDYDEAHKDPLALWGIKSPTEEHELMYDSASDSLEPVYFWILDFLPKLGLTDVEKLVDNFISSPGSGHFSELSGKATRMQEEAMKMLGSTNQVLKSILNLIYDLKEMKLILRTYEDTKSSNPEERNAAKLTLKQRWMDMVDFAKRGTTSIKQLAAQMDYVTLIDAFMAVNSLKDVDNLDLNERVKRILKQRIADFLKWVEESEKQLRQRYKIEKHYLRSQVNTVKLYSRWIKPYLRAAQKLEQNASPQASLVTAFNTILLELSILAKVHYDPEEDIRTGLLPQVFEKVKSRKYYVVVVVDFKFRGIPQRASQRGDWAFGGKSDVRFLSYSLNEQELQVLKEELEKSDVDEVMTLIEGITTESLDELQGDIDEFLKEDDKEKEEDKKRKMKEQDVNPFTSLFSFLKFDKFVNKKSEKEDLSHGIKPDSSYEEVIRSQAIIQARDRCWNAFDIYKRAHKMPAHPNPFDSVSV